MSDNVTIQEYKRLIEFNEKGIERRRARIKHLLEEIKAYEEEIALFENNIKERRVGKISPKGKREMDKLLKKVTTPKGNLSKRFFDECSYLSSEATKFQKEYFFQRVKVCGEVKSRLQSHYSITLAPYMK